MKVGDIVAFPTRVQCGNVIIFGEITKVSHRTVGVRDFDYASNWRVLIEDCYTLPMLEQEFERARKNASSD